jgi:hypothetical protein
MQKKFGREMFKERPFRIPKRRWKYNIKMDTKEMMCEVVGWIQQAQDGVQRQLL